MKTLTEKLSRLRDKEAHSHAINWGSAPLPHEAEEALRHAYAKGFDRLSGIVVALAETLEKYKHISLEKGPMHFACAAEALAWLNEELEGE